MRVELIGAAVVFAVGVSLALQKYTAAEVDAGWGGLCLSYASMFTDVLTVIVVSSFFFTLSKKCFSWYSSGLSGIAPRWKWP